MPDPRSMSRGRVAKALRRMAVGTLIAVLPALPFFPAAQARASFPGDNGLLAFGTTAPDGTTYLLKTIDPETVEITTILEIPSGGGHLGGIEWMPDGRLSVVMQPTAAEAKGLYVVDHETGSYELLTAIGTDGSISWSPEGDKVVYVGNTGHIEVLDVASGAIADIGQGNEPAWSPTGEWIAYIPTPADGGRHDLWLMRPDGTDAHNLTNTPDDDETRGSSLDWSPDGTEVMVPISVDQPGKTVLPAWMLYAVDASSGARRAMTAFTQNHDNPAWSPDGKQWAYFATDWWGFGGINYGVYLSPGDDGINSRYTLLDQTSIIDLSWQPEPGCLIAPGSARPHKLGASEPEVEVGSWVAQGCFTKNNSVFTTKDRMELSGIVLDPESGSIKIDKDVGRITSTGLVKISLEGRSNGVTIGPVELEKEKLDWNLYDGRLQFKAQHFLSLPTQSDKLVIEAKGEGKSQINLSLGFPRIFGLGWVSPALSLRNGTGLDPDIKYEHDKPVQVTDLIQLNNLKFRFDPITKDWAASASVAGLGQEADIGFKYEKGALLEAHVGTPTLSLAGLMDLQNVRFEFDRSLSEKKKTEKYTLSAVVPLPNGESDDLTGSATYVDDALDAFDLRIGLAHVFGVVRVNGFNLSWSTTDGWSGGGSISLRNKTVSTGVQLELSLRSKKHKLVGGSLSAPLAFLGGGDQGFRLEGVSLSYSIDEGPGGTPVETWSGGGKVRLPGEEAPAIGGKFTFTDGNFVSATIEGENIYLGPGLKLASASGSLSLAPVSITGSATVKVGPHIPLLGVSSITGTLGYTAAAQPGSPDVYRFSGDLTIGDANLLGAEVMYQTDGTTYVKGSVRWNLGEFALVEGDISGFFEQRKSLVIRGNARVKIGPAIVDGRALLNEKGVAGCISLPPSPITFGFGYQWGGAAKKFEGVCDMDQFLAPAATHARRMAGATTLTLPDDLDAVTFEVSGQGEAPAVSLDGPKGPTIDVSAPGGFQGEVFTFFDGEDDITYVVIPEPEGGDWVVEELDGSATITGVRVALPLPLPVVTAEVTGSGQERQLEYSVAQGEGHDVLFLERSAEGVETMIGNAAVAEGTIAFQPSAGPAGTREVVAVVSRDGLVRSIEPVTSFETEQVMVLCSSADPCASQTSLAVIRKGAKIILSGEVLPKGSGAVQLVFERRRGGTWREAGTKLVELSEKHTYRGSFKQRSGARCRVTATFLGNSSYEASSARRSFSCG